MSKAVIACAAALVSAAPLAMAQAEAASTMPRTVSLGEPVAVPRDGVALPTGDAWTLRLQPRVWYAAPAGDVRFSGAANSATVELSDINGDSPRLSPFGAITIRAPKENLIFTLQGGSSSSSGNWSATSALQLGSIAVAPGDAIRTESDLSSFEVMGGYTWMLSDFDDKTGNTFLRFSALAGARLVEQKFSVARAGTTSEFSDTFAAPALGGRLEAQLTSEFAAELSTTAGIWPDKSSIDVDIAFTYQPNGGWWGAQIGYRLLAIDFTDGDGANERSYSGSLAGLYFGLQLRF